MIHVIACFPGRKMGLKMFTLKKVAKFLTAQTKHVRTDTGRNANLLGPVDFKADALTCMKVQNLLVYYTKVTK